MRDERGAGERQVHCFADLEIDEALRHVRRAGAVVAVEPKPFELLVFLIRNRHRVVAREELMQALWPDAVVSEATLSSAVRRAREAIAPHRDLIEGVRKVGYRFAGQPEVAQPGMQPRAEHTESFPAEPAAAPYFGRESELGVLGDALRAALAGHGTLLAISGEAGIGKTRTIEELLRTCARGAEILIGRCYEGEGGQAFWPWVQIFRAFAAHRDAGALTEILGAEAADIARLTSAVVAPVDAAPLADPEMLRARLFDAAVAVLRRAARRSPIVVVLDDLHWADRASLTLLLAVARQIGDVPLAVLGTLRATEVAGDHPLASLLTTARRESLVHDVHLEGLAREEAAALLRATTRTAVSQAAASAVYDVTEGNPFFLLEYWRDLQEGGTVADDAAADAAVPAGVADTIGRRVRRLTPECVRLLTIGAVMGRTFDHEILCDLGSTSPANAIELLDQAAAAHVIREVEGRPGSYRFAHALIRQTLYQGMTTLRRAALHRYVGEAIERSSRTDSREVVAKLAYHYLLAGPAGGARQAIVYAERAAVNATQACAYDSAVEYLQKAAVLAARLTAGHDDEALQRCRVETLLAEALGRAGDGVRMRESFERAAALARAIPAPALLARVAIGMARGAMLADETVVRACEEALSMLDASDVAARAQVQAALAKALYLVDGTHERRRDLCAQARAAAQATGDPRVLGEVLADCLEAQFNSNELEPREELAAALVEVAEVGGDARLRLLGQAWQIVNLMCRGQLNEIDRRLPVFRQIATELRQPRHLYDAAVFEAALLLCRGHLREAEEKVADALRLGSRIDEGASAWVHWGQLHHVRREQGRFAEFLGEGLALRLPPGTHGAISFQRSYRWAAPHVFSESVAKEAREAYEDLLKGGLDSLPPDNLRNTRIPVLMALAEACITACDAKAAEEIYQLLLPYSDQWFVVGWGSVVFASTHLMLGGLRGVQQRWDEAAAHFEEAMRQHDEQRSAIGQARTLYQWARMLRRRGDMQQARGLIERGLAICAEHELQGAAERLRRLLAGP